MQSAAPKTYISRRMLNRYAEQRSLHKANTCDGMEAKPSSAQKPFVKKTLTEAVGTQNHIVAKLDVSVNLSNQEEGPKRLDTICEEQQVAPESPKFGPANPFAEEEGQPQEVAGS